MSSNLEVNSESSAEDVVVSSLPGRRAVVDFSVNEVELQVRVLVPVPIQTDRNRIARATKDVVVGEVGIRVSCRNLPSCV